MRRIEVTLAGRWFLGFTILMGVTAIGSGNNVLYLLEALLLSGLLVSGILSERIIYSVDVEFHRRPASAGAPVPDRIRVKNESRFTHFCIEIGEWRDKRFHAVAYVPMLAGKEETMVPVTQILQSRGIHRWDGIAIATAFPFGFAKKVYVMRERGERLVWPAKQDERRTRHSNDSGAGGRAGVQFSEGEVRPMTYEDDARSVVWTLSAKGGERMVRQRRAETRLPELALDTRREPGPEFESLVIGAAQPFYDKGDDQDSGSLTLIERDGRRKIVGRKRVLDALATVSAMGGRSR